MLNILKKLLEKNLDKSELNHIFRDRENYVLTDMEFLLVVNHGIVDIKDKVLYINDKAKYKYNTLTYDNSYNSNYIIDGFKYPEYKRIMLKGLNKTETTFNDLSINETINHIQSYNSFGVKFKLMKKFELLKTLDMDITHYIYRDAKVPLALYGTINGLDFELVIMPVIFHD